jgi:hypothetical protein
MTILINLFLIFVTMGYIGVSLMKADTYYIRHYKKLKSKPFKYVVIPVLIFGWVYFMVQVLTHLGRQLWL